MTFVNRLSNTAKKCFLVSLMFIFSPQVPMFGAQVVKDTQTDETWNFLVYIAGNNNLHKFTQRSLNQMRKIGSNKNINIMVQLDRWGDNHVYRYYIDKKSTSDQESIKPSLPIILQQTPQTVSGTPESLYEFVKWGTTNYKADRTALILWNHGSGILDPHIWGRLLNSDRDELFVFNPETCMLELDRKSALRANALKGIAFNDAYEAYITNQELKDTLEKISRELLHGRKIDLLGMDACHMAMIEVASQIKTSVDYIVASEEIEPGPGWNYSLFLNKFENRSLSPFEFAKEIVNAYRKEYLDITPDFTQSAFDVSHIDQLEKNVSSLASLLVSMMKSKSGNQVFEVVKAIRNNDEYTTTFYNFNYIDLHHFYISLQSKIDELKGLHDITHLLPLAKDLLNTGISLMQKAVIANAAGSAIPNAFGMAIYFPTRTIHSSYLRTVFAQSTTWVDFIAEYLKRAGRIVVEKDDDTEALAQIEQSDNIREPMVDIVKRKISNLFSKSQWLTNKKILKTT